MGVLNSEEMIQLLLKSQNMFDVNQKLKLEKKPVKII